MAQTPASLERHPIHPMLVVFPIGLWVAALVFDILNRATGNALWAQLAFYNIAGGVIGALAAAVPGFVDWLSTTGRARRIGTWHMAINLAVVAVFAVNWWLRSRWGAGWTPADSWVPLVLSIVGTAALAVSGWLGGEMVYVERVGVDTARDERVDRRRAA